MGKLTMQQRAKVYAYLRQDTAAPYVQDQRITGTPWVPFGRDNLFPQHMRTLADTCVPLSRAIEMAALFIAGDGIKFKDKDDNDIPAAKALWDQWMSETSEQEFLYNTALDMCLLGSFTWTVRRSKAKVVRLDHLDASRSRTGKLSNGKPEGFYWSSDWCRVGPRGGVSDPVYQPERIPNYYVDPREVKSLIYGRWYKQGRDFYGEPWWIATVPDCEVWGKVAPFNATQIDTGFKPSMHIHTRVNGDEKDLDEFDKAIEDVFTGPRGKGVIVTHGAIDEPDPIITKIERGDHAGELDAIREMAEKVILRGFGIPDVLYRMDTGAGMQAPAIRQAMEQFESTFVEPRQELMCQHITRLMNDAGIVVNDVEIEGLSVFSEDADEVMLRQSYMRAVTIDEHREEIGKAPLPEGGDVLLISAGADAGNANPNTAA